MVGKEPEVASTARTVADNVERLRTAQNMNYKQLSDRLQSKANWSINAVGIRRIESGERRVTPDDLVALAVGLGVSPVTLLMPDTEDRDDPVTATGLSDTYRAEDLWKWMRADQQLTRGDADARMDFMEFAVPAWRRREWAEGILKLLEVRRLEIDIEAGGEPGALAQRRLAELYAEMQAEIDGDD